MQDFFVNLTKRNNFCDFLFIYLDNIDLQKLVHSSKKECLNAHKKGCKNKPLELPPKSIFIFLSYFSTKTADDKIYARKFSKKN